MPLASRPFTLRLPPEIKKKLAQARRVTGLKEADIARAALYRMLTISTDKLVEEVIESRVAQIKARR